MPATPAIARLGTFSLLLLLMQLISLPAARAQYSGPYLEFQAGGYLPDVVEADDSQGSFNLEFASGFSGGAVLGYELEPASPLGNGRLELAYNYLSTSLDKSEFSSGTVPASGDLTVQTLLFNIWGAYRNPSRWTPYYGGGLGLGRMTADRLSVTGQPLSDDSGYGLAYQLGLGVDWGLTEKLWLDLGYRFLGVDDVDLAEAAGDTFQAHFHGHSLVLGLRFGFF